MRRTVFIVALAIGASLPMALAQGSFSLRSPEAVDGGTLPKEFTGDGDSATLPLEWSSAPAGTKSYALIMHHVDPEGRTKWYWILYNIPASVQRLPKNVKGVGTLGNNSINGRTEYAPPHSKGPGPKTYVYTAYALSAPVELTVAPSEVSRDVLLKAMQGHILGSAELRVVYTRPGNGDSQGQREEAGPPDHRPRDSDRPGEPDRRPPPPPGGESQRPRASAERCYSIVDTGQDRCYGNEGEIPFPARGQPLYGQDAQHQGHRPAYRDDDDGTVTDLNTGLILV